MNKVRFVIKLYFMRTLNNWLVLDLGDEHSQPLYICDRVRRSSAARIQRLLNTKHRIYERVFQVNEAIKWLGN